MCAFMQGDVRRSDIVGLECLGYKRICACRCAKVLANCCRKCVDGITALSEKVVLCHFFFF